MMILSIDFGGTRTRAGVFAPDADGDLRLINRLEIPSQVSDPPDRVIQRMIDLARAVSQGSTVRAIGISAPGPLDPRAGVIYHARTLPGWSDVPLSERVSAAFDHAPTVMHNDANLAALAEYERGAARGCDPVIYLTISTGIGGGVVIGGHLFSGWSGLAAEPGHQLIPLPDGDIARLEDVASGTGIGALARAALRTTDHPSSLRDRPIETIDGKAVGEAAVRGDPFARQIVERAGRYLGIGLVNLVHILSPEAIVIGGSAAQLGDLLLEPARAVIAQYVLDPRFVPQDLIRQARLGDDVCLIGAAYYALRTCL
ncbi:MAG: ROK family protein [Candidatus Flexifilum sp.]|jgi:glucokinase